MSPPSQGYESTRMVPGCHSASQTSQHSSSHRFLNTQQSKVHQLSSLQPTQPKRMDPLLCHASPSGCPPPSRAPMHLVKNLHAGTLRIHNCEKNLAHAHASQAYMHQFMAGIHQQLLQPTKQWLLSNNSFFFSKPRSK
jgi:hypothetical protein